MVDNSEKKVGTVSTLDPSLTNYAAQKTKKNSDVDKNDFIQMLVTQLKNQDPMDPMNNDRFAVDLATFSQLEQLISINEKVGKDSTSSGDVTSMASFLGTDVKLKSQTVNVKDGDGGSVSFKLDQDAVSVEVQLLDSSGQVVDKFDAGALKAGEQSVSLQQLKAASGSYSVKVAAQGTSGVTMAPEAYVSGTVVGYRPAPDSVLIIGNQEYSLSDILEVRLPKQA